MKTWILLLVALALAGCGGRDDTGADGTFGELCTELDNEIARSRDYEIAKENRIARLQRDYALARDEAQRVEITDALAEEFNAYNADSALYYINLNLRRPSVRRNPAEYNRLRIRRADVMAHAGLFSDALSLMREIPRDSLDPELLEDYYSAYCALYQYLSEYTDEHETALNYERLRTSYADSLRRTAEPGSFNYRCHVLSERARAGELEDVIGEMTDFLGEYTSGTREYSILASTLAYIYQIHGYRDEGKRYLILSAISDVKGAVKENMSFRAVATLMFEDGDIERANRYLMKSIADANFYSALMRNAQSSKMLPVIDEAYSQMQHRNNRRLQISTWTSTVLSFVLVITLLFILSQIRKLRRANAEVNTVNTELSVMSAQLRDANSELERRNFELRDYNKTKEQYAGLFMEYCSSAISTLQRYQQSLRVLTAKGGNKADLLKKLESTEVSDQLLKNFYVKFDEAILNIYPSFVERFNALLRPGEQVELKPGELLNTELRLFALVRLGMEDSAKIAEFLRCSLSTVYTYRSKMRKRALNPDRFEEDVKNMI